MQSFKVGRDTERKFKILKARLARIGTLVEQPEEITLPYDENVNALPLGRGREGWGDSRLSPAPKQNTRSTRPDHLISAFGKLRLGSNLRICQKLDY